MKFRREHLANPLVRHLWGAAVPALALTLPSVAWATDRNVGSGQTYATIQLAIQASEDGDTIRVWPGTYTAGAAEPVASVSERTLTIESTGGPLVTIIDGQGTRRGVVFDACGDASDHSALRGFTIRNTKPTVYFGLAVPSTLFTSGASIACFGSYLDVSDCLLQATNGVSDGALGGACCVGTSKSWWAALAIDGCVITDCSALKGGAIGVANDAPTASSSLLLANCTVQGCNGSQDGGAIYARDRVNLTIAGTSFLECTSMGGGGAICLEGTAHGNPFAEITAAGSTLTRFEGCWAFGRGGAVALTAGASMALSECVFDGNSSMIGGTAILIDALKPHAPELTAERCLFRNHSQPGTAAIPSGHGSLLYVESRGTASFTQCEMSGNTGRGPLFDGWTRTLTVSECEVSENANLSTMSSEALVAAQAGATVTLSNSLFQVNSSGTGAGTLLASVPTGQTINISGSYFCGVDGEVVDFEDVFGPEAGYVQSPEAYLTAQCPPCVGDVARPGAGNAVDITPDGRVDAYDLVAILGAWGLSSDDVAGPLPLINLANDTVGSDDLALMLADWGSDCSEP